jgi:hypothetical protein
MMLIFTIWSVYNKDIAVVLNPDIWVEFILNISALVKAIIWLLYNTIMAVVVKPGIDTGLMLAIWCVDNKDTAVVLRVFIWIDVRLYISALVKAIIWLLYNVTICDVVKLDIDIVLMFAI